MSSKRIERPQGEVLMIVVTDSAADLTPEDVQKHDIKIAPLHIQFPEGGVSAEEITPDEFYRRLKAMDPEIPTTSQPSSGAFAELYKGLAGLGRDILSIHISSGLSGTLESARLGAQQAPGVNVTHVDSMTLSGGERYQVLAAAQAIQSGVSLKDIKERLDKIRAATETIYTLETLTYLARGGRIGRVQALAGSLLKLKPIIKVDKADGKYSTVGKERTLPKSLEAIREYLLGVYGTQSPVRVSVMHGQFAEQAHILQEMLAEKLNVAKSEVLRISPVLGVHTGPGVVGAAVVPATLFEGLD
jgi:DegV family protein with EDD domain